MSSLGDQAKKSKWVLTTNKADPALGKFPFIVQYLDDRQEVIPFREESYQSFDTAFRRAKFMNKNTGCNVRVVMEMAFCYNGADQ